MLFQDLVSLANFPLMNAFAAIGVLSRMSPEEFLEMSPESRELHVGPIVGFDRVVRHHTYS